VSQADTRKIAPQPWMTAPQTLALLKALKDAGIAARFVGGCVRDALLGHTIADIDLATPALPEAVVTALDNARIKAVPTGIEHGTITAVFDAPKPPRHFEITTLRRDVETYGRRARVAFDADWAEDAARRDFTINAIYLDPDGTLHDPVGGVADLEAHRVRFVGEPAQRIAEDVLRVLRYYRFEARFGSGTGDPQARAACHAAVPLVPKLSAERVAQELLRLLAVADPLPVLRMMAEDGVLAAIAPEATRLDRLQRLVALESRVHPGELRRPPSPHPNPPPLAGEGERRREAALTSPRLPAGEKRARSGLPPPQAGEGWGGGWQPDPLRRLAALIEVDASGAVALAGRLHLSNEQRDRLAGLARPWPLDPKADLRVQRLTLYRLGTERYRDLVLLLAADGALDEPRLDELLALAASWKPPRPPLKGRDITALGIPPGKRVGELLAAVRQWWEEGDFTADRAACLKRLKEIT
jgi:poly(A) polymerase